VLLFVMMVMLMMVADWFSGLPAPLLSISIIGVGRSEHTVWAIFFLHLKTV
jgi:hypothetical protein